MPVHPPLDDPDLGRVNWNDECGYWQFDAGPLIGRRESVFACYVPLDKHSPPTEQEWDDLRACIHWIRRNEPKIRQYLEKMVNEGGTPAFRETWDEPWLSGITFQNRQEACLVYTSGLVTVTVTVDCEGRFMASPRWFVSG